MDKKFRDLSETEQNALMKRYYHGETATSLIREYGLNMPASALYRHFPPEVLPDQVCQYCGKQLVSKRLARQQEMNRQNDLSDAYCPHCHHMPYADNCRCKNCLKVKLTLREQQEQLIRKTYARKPQATDFSKLTFVQRVYVGTLCNALGAENLVEIEPYNESDVVLAPTAEITADVYRTLIRNGIIDVSPNSPLEAFNIEAENFPGRYYIYRVRYDVNLLMPPDKDELFAQVLYPSYYTSEYEEDAYRLWKDIAIGECCEYLNYSLQKLGFPFSPGDKTQKVFEELLNDYSVAQIYTIIWKAVTYTTRWYQEKRTSKRHAANYAIGSIERFAATAKANSWDVKAFERIRDLPQSALSWFFFYRVLGIGEQGFKLPPTIVKCD